MPRPKAKAPARRYHISGQSVVTIGGRDFYLGPHDSPESIVRYAALIALYQASGLTLPEGFELASLDPQVSMMLGGGEAMPTQQQNKTVLVRDVTAGYRTLIRIKYASHQSELDRTLRLCDEIDEQAGSVPANEYGPVRLQELRRKWVGIGNARVYCNRLTNAVIRCWKWAVSQELVDESAWRRLRSVEPLRIGQTEAHETEPVEPVSLDVVKATAKELTPILKAMIRIQAATGMRPSEVCMMRPADIDRSGDVWFFRPKKHKTANRGKKKSVPLIGDARDALTDYLNRGADEFCFSPKESVAWVNAKKRSERQSKVPPSQASRAKSDPRKQPGDHYTHTSYRQSIQRAAKRAGVESWHPYQLRHTAATVIRDALGVEAAQSMLGHSRASMTEHYAKQTDARAIEAAKVAPRIG